MDRKIFKYEMGVKEKQELELPIGSRIIRVDDVDGKFFLWAIVNAPTEDDEEIETETRYLEFYKTGQTIGNDIGLVYIGFCKLFIGQELGLYVFERVKPTQPYTT